MANVSLKQMKEQAHKAYLAKENKQDITINLSIANAGKKVKKFTDKEASDCCAIKRNKQETRLYRYCKSQLKLGNKAYLGK